MTEKEINLAELIYFIWKNKLKLLLISFSILIIVIAHYSNKKIFFEATTEIKPISAFEDSKYKTYNSYSEIRFKKKLAKLKGDEKLSAFVSSFEMSFEKIHKDYLFTLFIDKLSENKILTKGIKKLNILNRDNFESQKEYDDTVKKLASSIKIVEKTKIVKNTNIVEKEYQIVYSTDDKNKWEEFLKYIETEANQQIKIHLNELFIRLISHEKKLEMFEVEDYELQISDLIKNYEKTISRRLVFLREQAQIARRLEIPTNNLIEAQTFATDTGIIANLRTEIPYYMRGYEMIEEEIMLIENRKDKAAFIEGLNGLEKSKDSLNSNKDLERLEILFSNTPIADDTNDFKAGNIMFLSTSYTDHNLGIIKVSILAIIIGFIFGVIYILVENAIRSKK